MKKTFAQIADLIASSLSSTMQTAVLVKDSKQNVVAGRHLDGSVFLDGNPKCRFENRDRCLTLPLHVHDQTGEIQIKQTADDEPISPKLAQAFVDLVVSQVAYPAFPDQKTFKNQIISNLLRDEIGEIKVAQQQANLLGIDFAPPRAVILIDMAECILKTSGTLEAMSYHRQRQSNFVISNIVKFFNLPDDTICADLGGGEFAVLKASDTKNLNPWAGDEGPLEEDWLAGWTNLDALKRASGALLKQLKKETKTALSIGIGRYHPGISGLARSYQDARVALRLGKQFKGPNRVHCLDDLGIAAFACIADERTKVELALHLLSPLENEPELTHTLKVFFAQDCALSVTARHLCIHRNTLTYRLEKITSLTGLDPRRFDEAVQIRLALLLQEVN